MQFTGVAKNSVLGSKDSSTTLNSPRCGSGDSDFIKTEFMKCKFISLSLYAQQVHLLGASLGGFLAQKFAETFPDRVESLILCNTFSNTRIFESSKAASTLDEFLSERRSI